MDKKRCSAVGGYQPLAVADVFEHAKQAVGIKDHKHLGGSRSESADEQQFQLAVDQRVAGNVDEVVLRALSRAANFDFHRAARLLGVVADDRGAAGRVSWRERAALIREIAVVSPNVEHAGG